MSRGSTSSTETTFLTMLGKLIGFADGFGIMP